MACVLIYIAVSTYWSKFCVYLRFCPLLLSSPISVLAFTFCFDLTFICKLTNINRMGCYQSSVRSQCSWSFHQAYIVCSQLLWTCANKDKTNLKLQPPFFQWFQKQIDLLMPHFRRYIHLQSLEVLYQSLFCSFHILYMYSH